MDFGCGWDLSTEQQCQLHVLEWLYDRVDGQTDQAVDVDPAVVPAPVGCARPAPLKDTFNQLYRDHLVWYVLPHDGPPGTRYRAMLTEACVHTMRQIRQRRADPAARRVAARDALLRWAYERAADGEQTVAASGFTLSRYARFLSTRGDLFAYTEITNAVDWLARHGYLHAAGTGGDMTVTITDKGEHTIETGRSTRDDSPVGPSATSITITGSRNVNVAAHSPGASQAITGTVNEEAQQLLADLADYLQQHSAQLAAAANVPRRAAQIVIDLRSAAAEPTPDPSGMRKILDTVRQIGIGAASVPAGAGLLDLVERPAHALGL